MWKNANGELIQVTDTSRVKFRTNISSAVLVRLKRIADEHDTYMNYLLETGLQNLLADGFISYNKKLVQRIEFSTKLITSML